jgi:hypothetical protein
LGKPPGENNDVSNVLLQAVLITVVAACWKVIAKPCVRVSILELYTAISGGVYESNWSISLYRSLALASRPFLSVPFYLCLE